MWPPGLFCDPTWWPLAATLLHFVWQGLVVAAAWKILFRCFRGCRSQTQYLLGLAGLLALTACPMATFALLNSNAPADGAPVGVVQWQVSPSDPVRAVPVRISKVSVAAEERPHWQNIVQQWADAGQPYVIGGWVAGLTILSGRLLFGFLGARRLRRGRRPVSAALADRVAAIAGRLGLRRVPGVFVSDVVRDAVVTGLLRPMVLLPAAWLLEMTPDVLEAVIAHELAHIRRFDLWVNLFQRLVETILFYHPAVWWLSHRVRLVREMCCDELAVAATGERVVYATALEFAARRRLAPAKPLLEVALGATRMTLLSRVRNVLGLPDGERKGRWWPMMVLLLLVLLAGGLAIALVGRGKYVATTYLRIAMQEKPIAFPSENQTVDRDRFEIYKSTQQQLVMSRFVLMAALRRPDVAKLPSVQEVQNTGDAVNWLMRRLNVSFPGKAEIMEVSVRGNDPQEVVILDRAVVDAYMKEVVESEREQKRGRLNELDRAFVEKEREIRGKREDLKLLAETLGTSETEGLTVKQKLALEELGLCRQELAKARFELRRLRSELSAQQALLKSIDSVAISDDELESAIASDPVARQLFVEMGWRKLDKTYMEGAVGAGAKPENAGRQEKDLQVVQKQYDARRAELLGVVREKKRSVVRNEIQRLETAIAAMTEERKDLEEEAQQASKKAERFGSSTVDIEMMRADIKNLEGTLSALAQEREKLRVEVHSTPRITAPFGRAEAPKTPTWWW